MAAETVYDFATLQAEIKKLRDDFAKVSETVAGLTKRGASEAVAQAQGSLAGAVNHAKSHANELSGAIQEKPLSSAVTAFGIGIVLGLLYGNRRA